jgi:two-component system, OmpR family, response regulator ResD
MKGMQEHEAPAPSGAGGWRARTPTVLIVDDDPQLRLLLGDALRREGFAVEAAASGEAAPEMLGRYEPDVILLDVLPPGPGALETCRRIRARSPVPIIMLAALGRDEDVVAGLEAGADSYCAKPVSPAQLAARIRALLRRRELDAASARYLVSVQAGDLAVDPATRQAIVGGHAVGLSAREFSLLERLARSPGRVVGHEELLQHVWGSRSPEYLGHLRSYIRMLRRKVEPDPHHPRYIRSRHGLGYMLGERSRDPVPADAAEVAPARRA